MNVAEAELKYSELIRSIKRKRAVVYVVTVAILVLTVLLTIPFSLEVMGEMIIDREGLNPILIVLICFFILFVGIIAYGIVSAPLVTALNVECDPEKQVALNLALDKNKNTYVFLAPAYLYLGEYGNASECAMKMIGNKKDKIKLDGFFVLARCEFMTGNKDSLKKTATKFKDLLMGSDKINKKLIPAYQSVQLCLDLMVAISDSNTEKMNELYDKVIPWNETTACKGFLNYLKGMASCIGGNRDEAVYRFRFVKDNCPKTVFARLSEKNLTLLD